MNRPVPTQARAGGILIAAGYLCALFGAPVGGVLFGPLGGLLGAVLSITIGGTLWRRKVQYAPGQNSLKYDEFSRRHGMVVLVLGTVMFAGAPRILDRMLAEFEGGGSATPTASTALVADGAQSPENASQASGENEILVDTYLNSAHVAILQDEGFGRELHRQFGSLDAESSEEIRISLPPNTEIAILAVCDNECDNIDLVLFDASGDLIDEDRLSDDVPVVEVTTGASAEDYVLRVGVVTCTIAPCYYSFGVYVR